MSCWSQGNNRASIDHFRLKWNLQPEIVRFGLRRLRRELRSWGA
jgi:hypothetical protein